jgi:hypothetical protein
VGGRPSGLKGQIGRLVSWPAVRKEAGPVDFSNWVRAQDAKGWFPICVALCIFKSNLNLKFKFESIKNKIQIKSIKSQNSHNSIL